MPFSKQYPFIAHFEKRADAASETVETMVDADGNETVITDIERFIFTLIPPPADGYAVSDGECGDVWLRRLLNQIERPFTVIIEEHYVDREFRDSYYLYFSNQHFNISRFCNRLAFFRGVVEFDDFMAPERKDSLQSNYIGCCVLRPLEQREIGKTLLDPRRYLQADVRYYLRMAQYTTTVLGVKLKVTAFPYSTQDGETTRCSDITILNLLDYHAQKYSDYHRAFPSEIREVVRNGAHERVLPALSMDYYNFTRVLAHYGFYPRHYHYKSLDGGRIFLKQLLYYYIESGIPVAVGLASDEADKEGHSVVCIGHSDRACSGKEKITGAGNEDNLKILDTADFYDYFIFMDDRQEPYAEREFSKIAPSFPDMNFDSITVPLYRRMFMDASDACKIFDGLLESGEFGVGVFLQKRGVPPQTIIKRMFLTTGQSYKNYKLAHLGKEAVRFKESIAMLPLSHFIWVCELYFPNDYLCASAETFGELILDAASKPSTGRHSLIYMRYFEQNAYRYPDEPFEKLVDVLAEGSHDDDIPQKQAAYRNNLKALQYPGA